MNSTQSDAKILAKGAGIALIGKIIGRGLQLAVQVALARMLGPMQFGLYVLGSTVLQVGQQIGLMGLDNGVIHFGGLAILNKNKDELSAVIRSVQLLSLGSALLVGLIVYILAPWFALNIFRQVELINVLRGFALALVFATGLRVNSAGTRISRKMHFSVLSEDVFPYLVSLGLIILLFYGLKLSLTAVVITMIVGFGAGWLLALFFLQRLFTPKPSVFSIQLAKDLLLFSLPTFLAVMFLYSLQGVTIFFIGYYLSPQDVGIYQAASQISTIPVIILLAFNAIFTPMIHKLKQESHKQQLNELFKISTKWGLYVSLPLLLTVIFMPRQLLEVLYGQAYLSGVWPLVILILAQSINTGTGAVGFLLVMNGYQNHWLFLSGISFIIGLILNIWLIPQMGIIGAALANACGVGIMYLAALFQVRSLLGMWPYDKRYWKGLFSAVVSAGVILLVSKIFPIEPFQQIVIALGGAMTVFLLSLSLLRLDQEDWQALSLLVNK